MVKNVWCELKKTCADYTEFRLYGLREGVTVRVCGNPNNKVMTEATKKFAQEAIRQCDAMQSAECRVQNAELMSGCAEKPVKTLNLSLPL